ncbi:ergothioneine biosynthesis protein EgtB [Portibacter lacus]|uniref:Ergothioneine biosynthesis protein EgtB n=1 Tax=Portibacter lacus TaxID=1099794 RepID=A0AA37WF55_9BACT|nr:ergothioneine biosynthesis protein EgtB [Portibacter lacus]GLR18478.1 ergothioneine biosynthesis protein EgtB [Portibacter lacus]
MNIAEKYISVRGYTEQLCEPLQVEDYIPQPEAFVSPPKWHLAHTTWFFEAFVLEPNIPTYQRYHEDFSFLFNSYYNAAGDRIFRADRGNITRPGVQEIYEYRAYVDKAMESLLDKEELKDLIIIGLNHEQQHQELLITDLKFTFSGNPIHPVYKDGFSIANGHNAHHNKVSVSEGVYEIGHEGSGFFYDNEKGRHKVYLHDFTIDNFLVTNGEYLAFINDGGYEKANLWLDEGWAWVNDRKAAAPLYWYNIEGAWKQYTLGGLKEIEEGQVLAHVNFYEAYAYAEWAGRRLPTEFEWEIASDQLDWGARWEWTHSAYLPYPGFKTAEGALGEYNGKFMINQMVLRGGSQATSPGHSRKTYRNFFHASSQWQSFGIRLADK